MRFAKPLQFDVEERCFLKYSTIMLCSLCSIVNKILAHVIESLLVFFFFFKILKCPNISGIWVVYFAGSRNYKSFSLVYLHVQLQFTGLLQ